MPNTSLLTKSKALERLTKALDAMSDFKELVEFEKWQRDTEVAIRYVFGEDSSHVHEFKRIGYAPNPFILGAPESVDRDAFIDGLRSAESLLRSMIDEVQEYRDDDEQSATMAPTASAATQTNEVFIIHGRDAGTKETVARFIETIGLKAVILHERPNEGRTIIEKFEENAQVGFAIVLLTPDDLGALKEDETDLKPRARQNVIFELGYFVGRLGRGHVCALTKGDVEIPSDYAGIAYIPLDNSGAWKMGVVRELKAAGFTVDANLAI